jgi:hypothetical protein
VLDGVIENSEDFEILFADDEELHVPRTLIHLKASGADCLTRRGLKIIRSQRFVPFHSSHPFLY